MDQTHALYRFFSATGELLYVGITNNPSRRWTKHAADKPWWHEVTDMKIELYPSKEAVLDAERKAIQTESPKYNVRMNGQVRPVLELPESATPDVADYPVAVGDCVALAVSANAMGEKDCPVGLVKSVSPWGVKLALMSFLDGYFGHEYRTVPWGSIVEIRHAPPPTMEKDPWASDDAPPVPMFETERLGDFQTEYVHGRERMLELRRERIREQRADRDARWVS